MVGHSDEVPAGGAGAESKPDFMVWPPIPDVPRTPSTGTPARPPRKRRRLTVRVLGISLILGLAVVAGSGYGAFVLYERSLDKNIGRIGNPFQALPERSRPRPAPNDATNILMLGSDSRISVAPADWVRGAQRTDAIMIAHIPADRSEVTVTSIPRDSWVNIPDHGPGKLNAAFSLGGPPLMIQTVEKVTGVRIDHIVIADFEGFKDITDELDGVRINVSKKAGDEPAGFAAGPQTMDGETALRYVRQRHDVPGGDFDRVKRQQNWIRAVTLKTLDKGTLTSPFQLNSVLGSLTSAIAADDAFSIGKMRSLAISLRGVRGSDVAFLTAPVASTGRSPDGKQAIVKLDTAANRALWTAVATDTMDAWLQAHPNGS
jgi:LCP family protein required for cell wall assembly